MDIVLDEVKDAAKVSCDSFAGLAAKRCVQLEACPSDHLTAESGDFTASDSNGATNSCADLDVNPNPLAYFYSNISANRYINANGNCPAAGVDLQDRRRVVARQ